MPSNICTNLRVQLTELGSLITELHCVISKNNDILQTIGLIISLEVLYHVTFTMEHRMTESYNDFTSF